MLRGCQKPAVLNVIALRLLKLVVEGMQENYAAAGSLKNFSRGMPAAANEKRQAHIRRPWVGSAG